MSLKNLLLDGTALHLLGAFLPFIGGIGASQGYKIQRSLRFRPASSTYLSRTPAGAGNQKTWTWSGWVKRHVFGASHHIFSVYTGTSSDAGYMVLMFNGAADTLRVDGWTTHWRDTTASYRDPGAWMHIVLAVDTAVATGNNMIRLYVNGVEVTSFGTINNPTANTNMPINAASIHYLGRESDTPANFAAIQLADVHFIDGQQLTPSSFGKTDPVTGAWTPIKYTGTYGTNGFRLDFSDNSAVTAAALGADRSGNGNNWTPSSFSVTAGVTNDSLVDTPTNYGADTGAGGEVRGNYATLSPLTGRRASTSGVLTSGNLHQVSPSNGDTNGVSTVGVSSGKWRAEFTVGVRTGSLNVGIVRSDAADSSAWGGASKVFLYLNDGTKSDGSTNPAYGASYTAGDTIAVELDVDTGTVTFFKNGATQGTAYSSGIAGFTWHFTCYCFTASDAWDVNFGQRPWANSASAGFKALCTANLLDPTIKQPNQYFDVKLWTGNGVSNLDSQTVNFSTLSALDLVIAKSRSSGTEVWNWWDSIRGGQNVLNTASTAVENSGGAVAVSGAVMTAYYFNAGNTLSLNTPSATYVAAGFKKGATPGFDIVSYTGNGTNRTIAHSLGVAPSLLIVKARNGTFSWAAWHTALAGTDYLLLNSNAGKATAAAVWNSTVPTSSVFSVGTDASTNTNTDNYIAYLFAEVPGFSKAGSYSGNSSADGPFIWCGFRPRFILWKRIDAAASFVLADTARDPFNVVGNELYVDSNVAESAANADLDILSNGFKFRRSGSGLNLSGGTYLFFAWAERPFKYARAR